MYIYMCVCYMYIAYTVYIYIAYIYIYIKLFSFFAEARCGDVLVNVIDLGCRGLGLLTCKARVSISIHFPWHPANEEGIQFASIHSKTILFRGLEDMCHQAKPMWWNPQTVCRLTANSPPLLQQQINPHPLWREERRLI